MVKNITYFIAGTGPYTIGMRTGARVEDLFRKARVNPWFTAHVNNEPVDDMKKLRKRHIYDLRPFLSPFNKAPKVPKTPTPPDVTGPE